MTIYDDNGDVNDDDNKDDKDDDDNTTTTATTMTMLMKMVVAIQWEKRQERAIQVADSLKDSQLCAQQRERGFSCQVGRSDRQVWRGLLR